MTDTFSHHKLFICFAAEDRYNIAEPIVYHLKNYGIEIWYDRQILLMGDNRIEKNLVEGAAKCNYAIIVLSKHTANSVCALEEISILECKYKQGKVTVFPILYELTPNDLPYKLLWIKELIFKEVTRYSGTREICNHIVCKITDDFVQNLRYQHIQDIINKPPATLPLATLAILNSYLEIDCANLNSRVTLLYSAYLTITCSSVVNTSYLSNMVTKIFKRLFSETKLNLPIDYRDLWILENAICILVESYLSASCTESNI